MAAAAAVAALNTLDQGKPGLLSLHWTRVNKTQAWRRIPCTLEVPVAYHGSALISLDLGK